MGSSTEATSTEATVLDALEQAEMAARELRLNASSEADAIVSAAKERAERISGTAGRRVEESLDELRRGAESEADDAITELEREAAQRDPGGLSTGLAGPEAEQAVATVLAHVLGEEVAEPAAEDGD